MTKIYTDDAKLVLTAIIGCAFTVSTSLFVLWILYMIYMAIVFHDSAGLPPLLVMAFGITGALYLLWTAMIKPMDGKQ